MDREKQFEYDIKGLILIMKDEDNEHAMIARSYVVEKLQRILHASMNFHPEIKRILAEEVEKKERMKEVQEDGKTI